LSVGGFRVRRRLAALIVLAGIGLAAGAAAGPNIPPSELPGRERDRFLESPVDRFTQPKPKRTDPLWRWDGDTGKTKRKQRGKKAKRR
jgi:hypothetical protein